MIQKECKYCTAFVIKRKYCLYFSNFIVDINKCPIVKSNKISREVNKISREVNR